MVDNDWMDAVIEGDGLGFVDPEDDGAGFRPTTIRTIVEDIRADASLDEAARLTRINEALAEEALNLRYGQTMANVEVEALRQHRYSSNVVAPDPDSRHRTSATELDAQADEIEQRSRSEFESGRSLLVDVFKELHAEGVHIDSATWGELGSIDDDDYVDEELKQAFGAGHADLALDSKWFSPRPVATIDLSKGVAEAGLEDEQRARDRDRQSYVEVESPVVTLEADREDLRVEQEAPDPDVAATVARHRREASRRQSSQPQQVGGLLADFMRQHGRGADGKPLSQEGTSKQGQQGDEPELG